MNEHEKLRAFIVAVWGRPVPAASLAALIRILDRMRANGETDEQLRAACRAKEARCVVVQGENGVVSAKLRGAQVKAVVVGGA